MRIWFNHWFSTAYHIINEVRKGCESIGLDIEIIGSNREFDCIYKTVCDEFYTEPLNISNKDYAEWCLNFCKEHKIDVFYPRRERAEIAQIIEKFDAINVKLILDRNKTLVDMLEDKQKTANYFAENNICKIPDMKIVNTVEEFKSAYNELSEKYPDTRIIVKYNKDEGALSFKEIDNKNISINDLRMKSKHLSYSNLVDILASTDRFDDLIVMPYLEGPEISIDSIMTSQGFVGISREKMGNRITRVFYDETFYEIAKKFAEISGITMPFNLQLRKHKNEWYLLEVNTRMAGGVHKTCLTGLNIPFYALCEIEGIKFELPDIKKIKEIKLTQIETPVILNKEEK